jgi:hypothetical protein
MLPPEKLSSDAQDKTGNTKKWPEHVDICCDDIQRHRRTQERFWRFQRCAWAGFAIIVVSALAGLTGAGGVLARTVDKFSTGLVDVPIITRVSTADDVRIEFEPGGASRSVHLSSAFLSAWQIETIQPAPDESVADGAGILLRFNTSPNESAAVHLFVKARETGIFQTAISIDAQKPVAHRVIVLP